MSTPHHSLVRAQFDRQVGHYLATSAMADRAIIDAIVSAASAPPGGRVLDVACGAGFLLRAYRDAGAEVWGIDLSEAMLREARSTLGAGLAPDHLLRADAAELPFAAGSFDVVACKLALHYFPEPNRVVAEMARVGKPDGLIALIDRVAVDDPALAAAHNRLEKLRTPNKVHVYRESEVRALLESAGLAIHRRGLLLQPMPFEEWMAAAGAADRMAAARSLLLGPKGEDLTGLEPHEASGQLTIRHRTLILVARRAAG